MLDDGNFLPFLKGSQQLTHPSLQISLSLFLVLFWVSSFYFLFKRIVESTHTHLVIITWSKSIQNDVGLNSVPVYPKGKKSVYKWKKHFVFFILSETADHWFLIGETYVYTIHNSSQRWVQCKPSIWTPKNGTIFSEYNFRFCQRDR